MARLRTSHAEAIVLRGLDFGEADRLLSLYSMESGLVRAVARGVRRPKSRMSGHLDQLMRSQVLIVHRRSLDLITQAQTISSYLPLRSDRWRTAYGWYCADLVERFSEEGLPNRAIYDELSRVLERISVLPQPDLASAIRAFELHLLDLSGYRPQLFRCIRCDTPILPGANTFHSVDGGIQCPACSQEQPAGAFSIGSDGLKLLRRLQADDTIIVGKVSVPPPMTDEAERVLDSYLTVILERRPRTHSLLDALRRLDAEIAALPPMTPQE